MYIRIHLPEKNTLKRGSGRKVKRRSPVSQDALFYAVAFCFAAEQLTDSVGGNPKTWISFIGLHSSELILKFGQQNIEDWLAARLLPYGEHHGNKTRSFS